jgi:hypothetical protein
VRFQRRPGLERLDRQVRVSDSSFSSSISSMLRNLVSVQLNSFHSVGESEYNYRDQDGGHA